MIFTCVVIKQSAAFRGDRSCGENRQGWLTSERKEASVDGWPWKARIRATMRARLAGGDEVVSTSMLTLAAAGFRADAGDGGGV